MDSIHNIIYNLHQRAAVSNRITLDHPRLSPITSGGRKDDLVFTMHEYSPKIMSVQFLKKWTGEIMTNMVECRYSVTEGTIIIFLSGVGLPHITDMATTAIRILYNWKDVLWLLYI